MAVLPIGASCCSLANAADEAQAAANEGAAAGDGHHAVAHDQVHPHEAARGNLEERAISGDSLLPSGEVGASGDNVT